MSVTKSFSLRDARPEDAREIVRLVRDLAEYEKLSSEAVATEADILRELFAPSPHAFAMLAEVQGNVVGLALWFYNFSTFAGRHGFYVEDVYVEPAYRGSGIGLAFFRAMAQRALAQGCARMEWSVLDWNTPAVGFYRGLGAVAMDAWTVQRLSGAALQKLAEEG